MGECLNRGQMDFVGQSNAKTAMYIIIYGFTIVGFILGYREGRFGLTFRWSFSGYLLANALCFLSWPMWNRHPVQFQPATEVEEDEDEGDVKVQKKPKKKKKTK